MYTCEQQYCLSAKYQKKSSKWHITTPLPLSNHRSILTAGEDDLCAIDLVLLQKGETGDPVTMLPIAGKQRGWVRSIEDTVERKLLESHNQSVVVALEGCWIL